MPVVNWVLNGLEDRSHPTKGVLNRLEGHFRPEKEVLNGLEGHFRPVKGVLNGLEGHFRPVKGVLNALEDRSRFRNGIRIGLEGGSISGASVGFFPPKKKTGRSHFRGTTRFWCSGFRGRFAIGCENSGP